MIDAYRLLVRDGRPPAPPRRHRGGPAAGRAREVDRRDRRRCSPRASATRSATRSPPTRSRRRAPAARCSRRSGCASARASTSSRARAAAAPRSTSSRSPTTRWPRSSDRNIPLQVAVMGCVVNGPGEAREADLGIAAGRGTGHLFVKGKVVRVVPEAEMVDALVAEAERIMEDGIDAVARRRRRGRRGRGRGGPGRAARDAGRRREPRRREDRSHPRSSRTRNRRPWSSALAR